MKKLLVCLLCVVPIMAGCGTTPNTVKVKNVRVKDTFSRNVVSVESSKPIVIDSNGTITAGKEEKKGDGRYMWGKVVMFDVNHNDAIQPPPTQPKRVRDSSWLLQLPSYSRNFDGDMTISYDRSSNPSRTLAGVNPYTGKALYNFAEPMNEHFFFNQTPRNRHQYYVPDAPILQQMVPPPPPITPPPALVVLTIPIPSLQYGAPKSAPQNCEVKPPRVPTTYK